VEGLGVRLRDGFLRAAETEDLAGEDLLGTYSGAALAFAAGEERVVRLALKLYPERGAVLVEAEVLSDLVGLAGEDSFLASPLDAPVLFLSEGEYLLFTWGMVGPGGGGEWPRPICGSQLGKIPRDRPFAPLVVTDGCRSLAVSPASHFPVSPLRALDPSRRAIARGLHGAIGRLPKGTVLKTLLSFGDDPFETLYTLGEVLLALGGRGRHGPSEHPVLSRLGYWTDYGAYYSDLFHPADEKTLRELARYFHLKGIPVGYFGLDLWYDYERAGLARSYRPDVEKFPRGLGQLVRETDIPVFLHLSGFARDNAYQGRYRFLEGEEAACPAEPEFYRDLARELLAEGAIGVWHDHLRNQQGRIPELRNSLTAAEDWFRGMTQAFSAAGLPLMLSVPTMGFLLSATAAPGVIAARSGEDYLVRHEQQLAMLLPEVRKKYEPVPYRDFIRGRFLMGWLLWCLGMYPFHDVFITNAQHPEGFAEPRAQDEALMRALSCGPIGIGDKLGYVDEGIVGKLCFPDGELLKPDFPARPRWAPLREGLLVAVAETALSAGTWTFLAVYNLTEETVDYRLDPEELGVGKGVLYDYFRGRVVGRLAGKLPPEGGDYFVLTPEVNGMALVGLLGKYITVPAGRCRVEPAKGGLAATFRAPPGEDYPVGVYAPGGLAAAAEGAEILDTAQVENLHSVVVRPRTEEWTLILRRER
jgi:hypothetical protein